ncbi:unnamed protein product, partial [marine sediment metagenome]
TPTFYAEQGGRFVRVKATEDGVEFFTLPGGGDVIGPVTSADHSIVRFDGTDNKTIQDSLATINDAGSINIPTGQYYKINNVNLAAVDVGAIPNVADAVVSSHVDWGSEAGQIDTDDVPEGASNKYFLGFTDLFTDYSFTDNSIDWDIAYGWGDHSGEGYLKVITGESILDLFDTPVAFDDGKFAKSGAAAITFESITEADITDFGTYLEDITNESIGDLGDVDLTGAEANKILKLDGEGVFIIADDEDTIYTSSDFTHNDLTGYEANEHIDWTTDQG